MKKENSAMVIVIQGGREMAWNFGKIWDLSKTKVAKKMIQKNAK